MATHSSVLAWKSPRTEEPAIYRVRQSQTRLKQLSNSSSSSSSSSSGAGAKNKALSESLGHRQEEFAGSLCQQNCSWTVAGTHQNPVTSPFQNLASVCWAYLHGLMDHIKGDAVSPQAPPATPGGTEVCTHITQCTCSSDSSHKPWHMVLVTEPKTNWALAESLGVQSSLGV